MTDLTCAAVREQLLAADPVLLRARGDSPFEQHLRACAGCAAAARAMLAATDELGRALDRLVTGHSAREAAGELTVGAARGRTARAGSALRRAHGRWLAYGAPLAAAAILLLVLWQADGRQQTTRFEPIVLPEEHVPAVPIVNAPATGTVAVMSTSAADITVVWHF
ncbi:MAG TPA: hypothetical protein VMN60_03065 [Longimicrobiales bacterium]|nr:hypothetical protein [Longimicrobiales bacterium]